MYVNVDWRMYVIAALLSGVVLLSWSFENVCAQTPRPIDSFPRKAGVDCRGFAFQEADLARIQSRLRNGPKPDQDIYLHRDGRHRVQIGTNKFFDTPQNGGGLLRTEPIEVVINPGDYIEFLGPERDSIRVIPAADFAARCQVGP